ncbi:MAG TPA: copper homeostasis membrane protein CopD [Phenylobacterium sp.]|uniref:copper homeostasis membrane protein CopD n=1 Tax=Phenylobacterium sp. TaxID=1871053 RepID=UPI002B49680D|nr:copper homeostasis membrane protein CopD [Phenylobacterium sp.]HKR88005.1 copper homeostasis membrane protein CopD [Phenylobacterium sp.]
MDAALILVRLVALASGVALFGAPLFVLYGGPPEEVAPGPLKPLLAWAALTSGLAAGAALVLQTGEMAGEPAAGLDPATLRDVITSGGFGASILARLGAALPALGLLIALRAGRMLWIVTAALGAVGLSALAWSGHGAADEGAVGLAHTAADIVHLLAAGVWLGALLVLALLLWAPEPGPKALGVLHRALKGFSGVGSVVVAALIASGLANSWFLVGPDHVTDFAASLWGRLLLAKLAIFAAMLMLAALNRFRLTPRLEAALVGDPRTALSALRRSLALESAAGLLVLALVAGLGLLAPPAAN